MTGIGAFEPDALAVLYFATSLPADSSTTFSSSTTVAAEARTGSIATSYTLPTARIGVPSRPRTSPRLPHVREATSFALTSRPGAHIEAPSLATTSQSSILLRCSEIGIE
jgi:hypothetical protein